MVTVKDGPYSGSAGEFLGADDYGWATIRIQGLGPVSVLIEQLERVQ